MHLLNRQKWAIAGGLIPALLVYCAFGIVPIFHSFCYSLTDWAGLSEASFVGWRNISEALSDPLFWNSFKNNIYVLLASLFRQIPTALARALPSHRRRKRAQLFRTLGFMPTWIPT